MAAALACALFLVWQWKLDHAFTRRWTRSLPLLIGFLPAWVGACIGGWRSWRTGAMVAVGSLLPLFAIAIGSKVENREHIGELLETIFLGVSGSYLWWVWTWVGSRSMAMRAALRCTTSLLLIVPIGFSVARWVGWPVTEDRSGALGLDIYSHLPVSLAWSPHLATPTLYSCHRREATWDQDGYGRAELKRYEFGLGGMEKFSKMADPISREQVPSSFFRKRLPLWWPGKPQPQFLYYESKPFFVDRRPGQTSRRVHSERKHFIIQDPSRQIIYMWIEYP